MKKNNIGFTLVELIVTLTILSILVTVAYISYAGYLVGVRDTTRSAQLEMVAKGLKIYSSSHDLPLPDNKIEIRATGTGELIGRQGFLGSEALLAIDSTADGIDPKDDISYSYYVTKDKKYFQVMGLMEDKANLPNFGIQTINAADYSDRTTIVYGDNLGILTDEFNTPVHQLDAYSGGLNLSVDDANTVFVAHIDNLKSYKFEGEKLASKLYTLSKPGKYGAPKSCPKGFIGVWGDIDFEQKGFCVAKYEMTYREDDSPGTPDAGQTSTPSSSSKFWASYDYDSSLDIYSRNEDFAVANITQQEAIDACESLGRGYHLITNSEWMTIARNIEFESLNYSNKSSENENISIDSISSGYIYNGNSGDSTATNYGCSGSGYYDGYANQGGNTTGATSLESGCDLMRSSNLSDGEIIRDFTGNLWEHVVKNDDETTYNDGQTSIGSGTDFIKWDAGTITDEQKNLYGPKNSLTTDNGIGEIYYGAGVSNNIMIRGGSARDGESTGIYAVDLSHSTSYNAPNLGFRCTK